MYVNNEIGTIQPVHEIGEICAKYGIVFHTDAVQAAGNVTIDVERDHIDLLSLSGHKFHGPKGIGVLYISPNVSLAPFIQGGGQMGGKRSGTENVAGIVGLGVALQNAVAALPEKQIRLKRFQDQIIQRLEEIPGARLNGDRGQRIYSHINFSFPGVDAKALIVELDEHYGIAVSSASACSCESSRPSHVLQALGLPEDLCYRSLRISMSDETTQEEVNYLIKSVVQAINTRHCNCREEKT